MNDSRQRLRTKFLASCDLSQAKVEALAQDASFRRYFRIYTNIETYILMDAPVDYEDVQPYINIAKHLVSLDLRAPKIIQSDVTNGFILLEDFGDNTFTRVLSQNHNEQDLYQLATNSLIQLQKHPQAINIQLSNYSNELLVNEALLLCDWYYPKQTGQDIKSENRASYVDCWNEIFSSLPKFDNTLVLRDYHVDNLIELTDGNCGLLDFQDAVIGSPAYDLVSLLEDARRNVSKNIQAKMLEDYLSHMDHDQNNFMRWYNVLGAQRHCKVLGIFTRLSVRDGKHHYLDHIDRVKRLLISHLNQEDLQPLKTWLIENHLISAR